MKKSTFEMSYQFSDQLHEQNCQAVAHVNGVLNELVQLSSPVNISAAPGPDNESFLFMAADMVSSNTCCESSGYPAASSTLVDQIAPLVTAHISHARNVVVPLVTSLAEAYLTYLESAKLKDPSSMFEICKVKLPSILTDESFLSDLGYSRDVSKGLPATYLRLDSKTHEDIIDLCMTGTSRFDEQIKTWLMSKEPGWLEQVWHGVFGKNEYLPSDTMVVSYNSLENHSYTPQDCAELCLAVYLISRKLQVNVPEGVEMSLSKFDTLITTIKDFAAGNLSNHLRKVAQANTTNSLIVQYNEATYRLYVNDDLYGGWLDKGGSPEILLGMVCTGNVVKTIPEIDQKAEQFKKAWDNFVALHQAKEVNNRHTYARKALISLFNDQLAVAIPEEKDIRQKESNFCDSRIKKAYECINALTVGELDDAYAVCLRLVAGIRFNYTSAYYILKDIDAVCKANPNIDVREAANLATINYIGDYLADQIAIKRL